MQSTAFPRPKKRKVLKVDTPEWEDAVYVAKLAGDQMERVMDLVKAHDKTGDPSTNGRISDVRLVVELAVVFMCDHRGASVLDADAVPRLLGEDFSVVSRVVDAGFEFNNMTDAAMERVAKNSPATPGGKHG